MQRLNGVAVSRIVHNLDCIHPIAKIDRTDEVLGSTPSLVKPFSFLSFW